MHDQLEFTTSVNKAISDGKYVKDVKYSHSFDRENKIVYSAMILSYEYQELEQRRQNTVLYYFQKNWSNPVCFGAPIKLAKSRSIDDRI